MQELENKVVRLRAEVKCSPRNRFTFATLATASPGTPRDRALEMEPQNRQLRQGRRATPEAALTLVHGLAAAATAGEAERPPSRNQQRVNELEREIHRSEEAARRVQGQ